MGVPRKRSWSPFHAFIVRRAKRRQRAFLHAGQAARPSSAGVCPQCNLLAWQRGAPDLWLTSSRVQIVTRRDKRQARTHTHARMHTFKNRRDPQRSNAGQLMRFDRISPSPKVVLCGSGTRGVFVGFRLSGVQRSSSMKTPTSVHTFYINTHGKREKRRLGLRLLCTAGWLAHADAAVQTTIRVAHFFFLLPFRPPFGLGDGGGAVVRRARAEISCQHHVLRRRALKSDDAMAGLTGREKERINTPGKTAGVTTTCTLSPGHAMPTTTTTTLLLLLLLFAFRCLCHAPPRFTRPASHACTQTEPPQNRGRRRWALQTKTAQGVALVAAAQGGCGRASGLAVLVACTE